MTSYELDACKQSLPSGCKPLRELYDFYIKQTHFCAFQIKLQYPDEYLVSVSGHYCPVVYGGTPVIRSLTFKSNRRTFGPYGVEEGTPFTFTIDGGQVVGFKGRGGWYLDAIAFTLSPSKSESLFQKVQKGLCGLTGTAPKSSASKSSA